MDTLNTSWHNALWGNNCTSELWFPHQCVNLCSYKRGYGDNPSTKPQDLNVLMTLSRTLTRPALTQSCARTKGAQRAGLYQLAHILQLSNGAVHRSEVIGEEKNIRPPHNEHKPSLLSGSSGGFELVYPCTTGRGGGHSLGELTDLVCSLYTLSVCLNKLRWNEEDTQGTEMAT